MCRKQEKRTQDDRNVRDEEDEVDDVELTRPQRTRFRQG